MPIIFVDGKIRGLLAPKKFCLFLRSEVRISQRAVEEGVSIDHFLWSSSERHQGKRTRKKA